MRLAIVLLVLCGCAAPQPVRYDCPPPAQHLLEHRDIVTCRTGPWPNEWRWLVGGGEWPVRTEPLCSLGVLVLPAACEVFDVDRDGDVDLDDYARWQNDED